MVTSIEPFSKTLAETLPEELLAHGDPEKKKTLLTESNPAQQNRHRIPRLRCVRG